MGYFNGFVGEKGMEISARTKGRVVIPALVRRRLGIKEGTRIRVEVDEKLCRIILTPITREYVQGLGGKYHGKGLLVSLQAEKARERAL